MIDRDRLVEELERYDAGLLGDGGGGDVTWWQDYLRAELERAHEFYADQFASLRPAADEWQDIAERVVEECAQIALNADPPPRMGSHHGYAFGIGCRAAHDAIRSIDVSKLFLGGGGGE